MLVRPMLLHRMALVSFRLFCKNLGNLQEFFGQMVYRPPWQKIARTPMHSLFALSNSRIMSGIQHSLTNQNANFPETTLSLGS